MQSLRAYDPEVAAAFKSLLFNDKPEKVEKWHALFSDPIFFAKQNLTLD